MWHPVSSGQKEAPSSEGLQSQSPQPPSHYSFMPMNLQNPTTSAMLTGKSWQVLGAPHSRGEDFIKAQLPGGQLQCPLHPHSLQVANQRIRRGNDLPKATHRYLGDLRSET